MTRTSLSDHEIDRRARVYARDHGVNYSEALGRIVEFAEGQPASHAKPEPAASVKTDAELDIEAKRYAAANGTDYFTALNAVTQAGASLAAQAGPNGASASDHDLHGRALAYAIAKAVSYSDALASVSFSEGDRAATYALGLEPLEIFRAGSHIDSAGVRRDFTGADIQRIAGGYDPARHEAPLVVGHPESDKPAYGWVKRLEATPDGRLLMHTQQVDPDYADMVKKGAFKKRSASFYSPMDPGNPTPGQWYLRHVGSLGAVPPAVKGLRDAQFTGQAAAVSFTFGL